MVVIAPDGNVIEQESFKGSLITQFPYAEQGRQDAMFIDWERENGKGDLQEGTSPATTTSTVLGPRKGGQVTNETNLISTDINLTQDNEDVNEKYSIKQTMTAAFKKWFGDWESVAKAKPSRNAATFVEAEKQAKEYAGKPIKNIDTGIIATVSKTNIEKMLSSSAVNKSTSAADHALAVANADQLFQHAYLDETHPDKNNEPTILAIHRFVSPLVTSLGNIVAVKMTVKETSHPKNPNPLYSIQAIEIEKPALDAPQDGIEWATDDNRNTPQASFSNKIVSLLRSVKPDSVSKVVDENGAPLVVYHVSPVAGITVFDRLAPRELESKKNRLDSIGTWFAESPEEVANFGKNIYRAYLSIKNPKIYESWDDLIKHFNYAARGRMYEKGEAAGVAPDGAQRLRDVLQEKGLMGQPGYDGIIVYDKAGIDGKPGQKYYVPFEPTQIKSAIGNVGTFDENNPDIRYSIQKKHQDPPVSKDPKVLNLYLKDETDAFVQTMMNKLHPPHMTWLETTPLCLQGRIPRDRHLLNTTTNYPISSELIVTILPIRKYKVGTEWGQKHTAKKKGLEL